MASDQTTCSWKKPCGTSHIAVLIFRNPMSVLCQFFLAMRLCFISVFPQCRHYFRTHTHKHSRLCHAMDDTIIITINQSYMRRINQSNFRCQNNLSLRKIQIVKATINRNPNRNNAINIAQPNFMKHMPCTHAERNSHMLFFFGIFRELAC